MALSRKPPCISGCMHWCRMGIWLETMSKLYPMHGSDDAPTADVNCANADRKYFAQVFVSEVDDNKRTL